MLGLLARGRLIRTGLISGWLLGVAAATPAMAQPELIVPELDQTAANYKQQVTADVDGTLAGVEQLLAALQTQDVAAARQAWIDARARWERGEVFTDTLFPDLERRIDGWPDAGKGFHAVETRLFGPAGELPMAETQELLDNLRTFRNLFGKQEFSGHMVMVGLVLAAHEIGESDAKGGESAVSGTSLKDLQHIFDGLVLAWNTVFADYVMKSTPHLAKDTAAKIDTIRGLLSVQTLDQIDPAVLTQQSNMLAELFTDIALHIGWRRPIHTETD
ncbi:MAG: iron uptake system component EfeO [Rhodospirillaceae bacterium]|nr:iron uptake system component EfeO [Rhodospirillaceae bacterium]